MKLRDVVIFVAGAEFFHTLSHIFLAYGVQLPLSTKWMVLTSRFNMWAILINAIITLLLLLWAKRLPRS